MVKEDLLRGYDPQNLASVEQGTSQPTIQRAVTQEAGKRTPFAW